MSSNSEKTGGVSRRALVQGAGALGVAAAADVIVAVSTSSTAVRPAATAAPSVLVDVGSECGIRLRLLGTAVDDGITDVSLIQQRTTQRRSE